MAYLAISQAFRRTLGRLIQLLLVLVPVPVPDLMSILVLLVLVVLVSAPVLLLQYARLDTTHLHSSTHPQG